MKTALFDIICPRCKKKLDASPVRFYSPNFFSILCSFNNSSLYQLGRFVFSWLFAPLKYLDWIFCKYNTAAISTSSVYLMGTKKACLA